MRIIRNDGWGRATLTPLAMRIVVMVCWIYCPVVVAAWMTYRFAGGTVPLGFARPVLLSVIVSIGVIAAYRWKGMTAGRTGHHNSVNPPGRLRPSPSMTLGPWSGMSETPLGMLDRARRPPPG
jgi:hypothetical protein